MRLETEAGTIGIDLAVDRAPLTVSYVVDLVERGLFDGVAFYRSTRLGDPTREPLIQGGPFGPLFADLDHPVPRVDLLDTVESTDITGLRHVAGTVSLARDLVSTGAVLPEVFICLDDVPELDRGGRDEPDTDGFPAFGSVRSGLDVVAEIAAGETGGRSAHPRLDGEILTRPVIIHAATLETSPRRPDPGARP